MKRLVSIFFFLSLIIGFVQPAFAEKVCKGEAITATGNPSKYNQIAEANSFLKWKQMAKKKFGQNYNKWSMAEKRNKGCERLLAGQFKGNWQCFRTGLPCREAKVGENPSEKGKVIKTTKTKTTKPVVKKTVTKTKTKTVKRVVKKKKIIRKKKPVRVKKRVTKRVKKKVVRKKVAAKRKPRKIVKAKRKTKVARAKIHKKKIYKKKPKKNTVARVRRPKGPVCYGAMNAYGKTLRTVRLAQSNAIKNWGLMAKGRYGGYYSSYKRARGKSIGCLPQVSGYRCAVYARPCR